QYSGFRPDFQGSPRAFSFEKGRRMTANRKLATVGGVALLFGIALMIVLHQFGAGHFATASTGAPGTYFMMPAMGEMGWAMALGPVAMVLWFCGILSRVVALIRSVAKAS
ncbi:MAG: hypothetical protein ACRD1G_19105, partial [Acidimicrobiales bacterium]